MKIAVIMAKLEESGAILLGRWPSGQVRFRCACGKDYIKSVSNVMKPGSKNRCQDCAIPKRKIQSKHEAL